MALAQAQFFTVFPGSRIEVSDGETDFLYYRAQSYWVDQKVRFGPGIEIAEFRTFDTGVIVNSSTGDAQSLSVEVPATDEMHRLIEDSIGLGLVWGVTIVQFEALSKQKLPELGYTVDDDRRIYDAGDLSGPDASFDVVARFYGEVVSASSDGVSLSLELGPSLNPTGSQVPPRKFHSSLIGAPLRL
jgi:hypothetical protein